MDEEADGERTTEAEGRKAEAGWEGEEAEGAVSRSASDVILSCEDVDVGDLISSSVDICRVSAVSSGRLRL